MVAKVDLLMIVSDICDVESEELALEMPLETDASGSLSTDVVGGWVSRMILGSVHAGARVSVADADGGCSCSVVN